MKSKLLILLLFAWIGAFAQTVPDTSPVSFKKVMHAVYGDSTSAYNLYDTWNYSTLAKFDDAYGGKTGTINLYAFRNYGYTKPTVTTSAISNITQTTADGGGNVTSEGSFSVTERGVCWIEYPSTPIKTDSHTSDGTGAGSFTSSLSGLTAGTTYNVRAYATSSRGTGYGDNVSFTTSSTPPCTINVSSDLICGTVTGESYSIDCNGNYSVTFTYDVSCTDQNTGSVYVVIADDTFQYIGIEYLSGSWSGQTYTASGTLSTGLADGWNVTVVHVL